ncbi:MAG TPA: hypothetical protein VFI02_20545 [Armatimonadota bacterium]|nr:hypothetical protein [Armatimonadota bacterium]
MSERFDVNLKIETVNSELLPVEEWIWKLRCPDLLGFVKEMDALYAKHHPGELRRPLQHVTYVKSKN